MNEALKQSFIESVRNKTASKTRELLAANPSLVENIDATWFWFDGTALIEAAGRHDRETVDALLDFGADINAKSGWWAGGFSAMHHVAGSMVAFNEEFAQYLLSRGATLDAWGAAGLNKVDDLHKILHKTPEVVNEHGPDGMSPLHYSATRFVADTILDHGADINFKDNDHLGTPAQWLVRARPKVAQHLVDRGAEGDVLLYAALGDLNRVKAEVEADPSCLKAQTTDRNAPGGYVLAYTMGGELNALQVAERFEQTAVADYLKTVSAS
ncbi:MAG: hypothetical protein O3A46_03640 [Candidatus Poribacteria bacterium]|nr:hypothetical protein [Candidatus Poribacteria bacterium]